MERIREKKKQRETVWPAGGRDSGRVHPADRKKHFRQKLSATFICCSQHDGTETRCGYLFETLKYQNPDIILISNEIGYGIVPLDRFERDWREKTGRICCLAAQESRSVIRVLAGNPVYIKGEQWA